MNNVSEGGERAREGLVHFLLLFGTAIFALINISSQAKAGITSAEPNTPIEFRLASAAEKAPLLELHLGAMDTYNTGFDGGDVYLSCYPGRFDHFRLNMVLHSNVAFLFERNRKVFIGVKSIDPSAFLQFSGEVDGTGNEDAPPSAFKLSDNIVAFQKAVAIWDEYEAGDETWLYVSSYPELSFIQSLIASNLLNLIVYDDDSKKFYSALSILYALDSALVGKFKDECEEG